MTKQEEIEGWLEMCLYIQRGKVRGKSPNDKKVAKSILEGLHSQGVVIKSKSDNLEDYDVITRDEAYFYQVEPLI